MKPWLLCEFTLICLELFFFIHENLVLHDASCFSHFTDSIILRKTVADFNTYWESNIILRGRVLQRRIANFTATFRNCTMSGKSKR